MAEKEKPKLQVRFTVDSDEAANKIAALLDALGFESIREMGPVPSTTRMGWAVSRLAARARLTERERDVLKRVLEGRLNSEIADALGISRATAKWYLHNIFAKTGVATREALLREALQIGGTEVENEGTLDDVVVQLASATPDTAVAEHADTDND